jgi:hypothetical protein
MEASPKMETQAQVPLVPNPNGVLFRLSGYPARTRSRHISHNSLFPSSSASFEIFASGSGVSRTAPLATDWLPTAGLVHGLILHFVQATSSSASLHVIKLFCVNSGPGDFQADPPPFWVAVAPFSTVREVVRTIPLSNRLYHFRGLRFLPLHGP